MIPCRLACRSGTHLIAYLLGVRTPFGNPVRVPRPQHNHGGFVTITRPVRAPTQPQASTRWFSLSWLRCSPALVLDPPPDCLPLPLPLSPRSYFVCCGLLSDFGVNVARLHLPYSQTVKSPIETGFFLLRMSIQAGEINPQELFILSLRLGQRKRLASTGILLVASMVRVSLSSRYCTEVLECLDSSVNSYTENTTDPGGRLECGTGRLQAIRSATTDRGIPECMFEVLKTGHCGHCGH